VARFRPSPRPRFSLRTRLTPAEVQRAVEKKLKSTPQLRGIAFEHRLEISMGGDEVRFWSPQIIARVEPMDGGARVDARFGPDPYVWAFYLLAYGALSLVTIFAAIYGIVQWSIHQTPTAWYVAPGAAVLAALVYGASFVGQGLSTGQMYFLRASLTETIDGEEDPT
jgi:hypothetical protein